MEKIKEIGGLLAITLFFGIITIFLILEYKEEYDLVSAEKAEARVVEKIGQKGLFTQPAYFVRVLLPNGEEADYLNRVSKKEIKNLNPGDTISGFSTSPSNFSTFRDLLFDSIFFLFGIALFGFIAFCCLIALITQIPAIDHFLETKTFLGRTSKGNGIKILATVIGIFLFFVGRFLINLFHKLFPFMKTKSNAIITDKESYISYRKYKDSSFQFTISFRNKDGEVINVIKDVTRHTYHKYEIGGEISVMYKNNNPYDLFISETTISDVFYTVLYMEFFVYVAMLAIIIFTGFVLWKKKENHLKKSNK